MATIQSSIELYDSFSPVLNNIMDAMNLTIASVRNMQNEMSGSIDTSTFEAAENAIHQAGAAMEVFNQQMQSGGGNVNVAVPTPEPVQVPVHWEVDNMEVFTNTGVERFQQEIQSANTMLNQLCSTQDEIARQAYNTSLFPPEAFQDLNSLAVRIDTIRERIQQIESNPINLGTEAANASLEQLRLQLNSAVQQQNNLNRTLPNGTNTYQTALKVTLEDYTI